MAVATVLKPSDVSLSAGGQHTHSNPYTPQIQNEREAQDDANLGNQTLGFRPDIRKTMMGS